MKNTKNWIVLAALIAAGNTVSPLPAQAKDTKNETKTQSNQTISLDGEQITISGETYTLSGSANLRSSLKQKGETATLKMHYDPKGARITAPDGSSYNLAGSGNLVESVGAKGGSFKSDTKFRLVGKGKGNKMRLHVTLRGKVDSNGQVSFDQSLYELI